MLALRTLFSILITAVIAAVLFLDYHFKSDLGFTLLLTLILLLGTRELVDLFQRRGYTPYGIFATVAVPLLVLAYWLDQNYVFNLALDSPALLLTGLGLFVALVVLQTFLAPRGILSTSLTIFAILYIWGLGSFVQQIRYLFGPTIPGLLLLLASVKASDIGGYLTGRFLGRTHPFKSVSPNKSVEGYVGALVLTFVVSFFFGSQLFSHHSWYFWAAFSLVAWFFAGLGDLFESAIKRDVGAKDSATRFPGLGGILDILDSVLLAAPPLYIIFCYMAG